MNRKQKIIISITGITIVMLALLGLTYGYYLTRIQGNTNSNSISVTTANLTLKYDDGTSYINLTNIMPGITTDGIGTNPEPKVFTVTNAGDGDVEYSIGMDEVTNTLTRTQDLTYSINCQEKLINSADTAYRACEVTPSNSGEYPKENAYLFTNQIKEKYVQKYTVVISYANPNEDQSIDMGSTIKGRMQIYSLPETIDITGKVTGANTGDYVQINSNPKTSIINSDGTYKLIGIEPGKHTLKVMNGSTTKGTKEIVIKQGNSAGIDGNTITFTEEKRLATVNITNINASLGVNITTIRKENLLLKDVIIENAQLAANENSTTKTIYRETPLTNPLEAKSEENERTLSLSLDNYGNSYYYRGNVEDNYLLFNDICWRIVRIAGDGSIKITLAGNVSKGATNCNEVTGSSGVLENVNPMYGYKIVNNTNGSIWNIADYKNNASGTNGLKDVLDNWFDKTFKINNTLTSNGQKIKEDTWCLGGRINYKYDSATNELLDDEIALQKASNSYNPWNYSFRKNVNNNLIDYKCYEDSETIVSRVGTLTANEVVLAGGIFYESINSSYYLFDNVQNESYYTLTLYYFYSNYYSNYGNDYVYQVYLGSNSPTDYGNHLNEVEVSNGYNAKVRPMITLLNNVKYSRGDGTQSNPYVIK